MLEIAVRVWCRHAPRTAAIVALWACASGAIWAQSNAAPAAPAPAPSAPTMPELAIVVPATALPLRPASAAAIAVLEAAPASALAAPPSRLAVVALPAEHSPALGAASRPHHALSIRSNAPQRLLKAFGVEASECSMQFRMPTHLGQGGGGSISLQAQAQMRLACLF